MPDLPSPRLQREKDCTRKLVSVCRCSASHPNPQLALCSRAGPTRAASACSVMCLVVRIPSHHVQSEGKDRQGVVGPISMTARMALPSQACVTRCGHQPWSHGVRMQRVCCCVHHHMHV